MSSSYKYMDCMEALELVELRIKEDNISWALAGKEYLLLTGTSLAASFNTVNYIRKTYSKHNTGE